MKNILIMKPQISLYYLDCMKNLNYLKPQKHSSRRCGKKSVAVVDIRIRTNLSISERSGSNLGRSQRVTQKHFPHRMHNFHALTEHT